MNEHNENDKLRVLLLKPGEQAEIAEIEDNLESMQRLVEGNIEEYMPFEDASDPRIGDCAIVCNEEEKMRKKFELPEQFYVSENGIRSKKMHPVNHDRKHQMER